MPTTSSALILKKMPLDLKTKRRQLFVGGENVVVGMYLGQHGSMQSRLRKQSLGFLLLGAQQSCVKCLQLRYQSVHVTLSKNISRRKFYGRGRVPIVKSSSSSEEVHSKSKDNYLSVSELTRDQLPTEQLTWEDVERLTGNLVNKIRGESYVFDAILAVTRGGLVPATIVAETLELRTVFVATVIFYGDRGDPFYGLAEPRILFFPENASLKGRKILIVDDVWDTGRTCKKVAERCIRSGAECKTAVLHYKPSRSQFSESKPDFFSVTTDRWIVYPWELHSPVTRSLIPIKPS